MGIINRLKNFVKVIQEELRLEEEERKAATKAYLISKLNHPWSYEENLDYNEGLAIKSGGNSWGDDDPAKNQLELLRYNKKYFNNEEYGALKTAINSRIVKSERDAVVKVVVLSEKEFNLQKTAAEGTSEEAMFHKVMLVGDQNLDKPYVKVKILDKKSKL